MDTICFFAYPTLVGTQNIFAYIFQGILFNYKYIITNIMAIYLINVVIWVKNNVEAKTKRVTV